MKVHRTIRYRLHPQTKRGKLFGLAGAWAGACRHASNEFIGKLRDDRKFHGSCNPYCRGKRNKRRFVLSRFVLFAAAAFAGFAPSVQAEVILVFGDSISSAYGMAPEQGWVHLLERRLNPAGGGRYKVVNASASGETTGGGKARLPGALKRHALDLVILELGGNDGLRGYPIVRIKRNLDEMISAAKAAGSDVLLLGMKLPPNYGRRYTEAFQAVYADLASRHSIPLVEFFLDGVAGRDELMQADGIHPKAAAQQRLLDNLWPRLDAWLEPRGRAAGRGEIGDWERNIIAFHPKH